MEIFGAIWDSLRTVWAPWVINYTINYVLVYMRSELAISIGFKKWNQCWMSGLPTDSPLFCFGTVKSSPGFIRFGPKRSMCGVHEIV